ncbi:two-component sensor histidine kinase yycG [Alkalihalophilus pseudofirmus OF4]|uniref:histidine kinase n=2 Tax=Alkalihalophilus pseudofirmus TaxID=79885 RepID=D3FQF1_ALKPO|nr:MULTISPECIES: cell wall metabolism sensor histidine kinase WalK [Alkalihalophilus]ADC49623.1 two-component sensor histidine kinase yycG [Alkalihalophilus pseudofirmus OF4]MDV2887395.1 cell wall metabolism sensor histidine kinase WalK [Alkalihalophilus pseudofirmus]MED1600516.1 cell wall metabolism sensor histidine kinase WalK [Alkalihalophilus marmarensis]OLS38640.1 cell wall metabolism sensor histidine kinase WalK [Alkalihalophilus pseudofirmus]WEG16962.1 cell wall metabolism sensor histid
MDRKVGFFRSIQFKLIIIYVLLIFMAMQIIGVYFTGKLEEQLVYNHDQMLNERANLLGYNVAQEMMEPREDRSELYNDINLLLRETFNIENAEVQVVDANSEILGTSNFSNRHIVGQQTTKYRVKRALLGARDAAIERDPQTGDRVQVLAVPIKDQDNNTLGAIYIESSMEDIYDQMQQINSILLSGTVIALLITAVLVILLARTITAPIMDMRKQALRMGQGDFSRQVTVYSTDEIGQLAYSFNDLTHKLQDATATRAREQKKLSSVLAHMTDGVLATDQDGHIILMNKRAEELLGVQSYEVIKSLLPEVLRLPETYELEDLFEQTDSILLDFSDDEQEFLIEANFSVIQEEDGPINGLITVLHDVTEQEKIEQDRREFVANVSHELRTPLTTMKSYLEALEDGALDEPELARRFVGVTQNETERMIRLVNDLLQLSKIDSHDYRLQLTWVDFGQFLHEVIDRFEMVAQGRDIHFTRHISGHPTYVEVDKDKLTQVIDNIISNAMKYSPEGGNITTTLMHQGHNVRVSISDEGMGIPRENQSKIFDRFYRVDKARARSIGGTGLGLAIAKELVHAHGGEIWVSSEYGSGTTIYFTLPYSTFKGGEA